MKYQIILDSRESEVMTYIVWCLSHADKVKNITEDFIKYGGISWFNKVYYPEDFKKIWQKFVDAEPIKEKEEGEKNEQRNTEIQ